MSVPLLWPVSAVVSRLDLDGTWAYNPAGTPPHGFDDVFREPVAITQDGATDALQYLTAVKVPVQVETRTYEELRMVFGGDAEVTVMVLVAHRSDLSRLSLIDASTGNCLLKKGDRIDKLEEVGTGRAVTSMIAPLFVYAIRPGSWGFGVDGHDLEIIYTTSRPADPRGDGAMAGKEPT